MREGECAILESRSGDEQDRNEPVNFPRREGKTMNYDERIHQLQTLMAGKEHVERVLDDLLTQRRELEKQVWDLNYAKMSEQQDVDKLEGVSLRSVILGLLGKKEERLDQERAELAAAVLKYDLAKRELGALGALIAEKQQIVNLCANAEAEIERGTDLVSFLLGFFTA